MLGHGATGQFAIGEVGTGTAEFIGPDKYMRALSEPVRFLQGLKPSEQQFQAFNPQPFVSFSWFEALAEPPRALPRSPAALYPNFFFQPAPSPFVATGWFMALSEPARTRPGLLPPRQSFFTNDTSVIPLTHGLIPWYAPLTEPVRFRSGLAAARQQFLAAPSQLRPNPATSGIINATETKDTMVAGGSIFNRVTSGEIGVIENSFSGAEIGVSIAAITSARISVRII